MMNGTSTFGGIPQRCVLGSWASLCNDGSNNPNSTFYICRDAGYQCKYYN